MPVSTGTWTIVDGTPPYNAVRLRYFGNGLCYHIADSYAGQYNIVWGTLRRSQDYGLTWTDLTPPIGVSPLALGCSAFDMTPGGRLYAGWCDANSGLIGTWYLYHSDDLGNSWTLTISTYMGDSIGILDIACHPANSNIVNVMVWKPVFNGSATRVSTNAGVTFAANNDAPSAGLTQFHPAAQMLYTYTGALLYLWIDERISRSTDNGANWTTVQSTTDPAANNTGQILRATATLYFAFRQLSKLYRSSDDGVTWTALSFPASGADWPSGIAYDDVTDTLFLVADNSSGSYPRQTFWELASASTVGSGSESWTQAATTTGPYESVASTNYAGLVIINRSLLTVTGTTYETIPLSGGGTTGGGGGNSGAILIEPFSRSFIDRFPRDLTADRKPERIRPE